MKTITTSIFETDGQIMITSETRDGQAGMWPMIDQAVYESLAVADLHSYEPLSGEQDGLFWTTVNVDVLSGDGEAVVNRLAAEFKLMGHQVN